MNTTADSHGGNTSVPSVETRRAVRRSRAARAEFWQTVFVSVFIALVIGANLFIGAVVVFGTVKSQLKTYNEPAEVRTGRFTQLLLDGTFCRTVVFDNKSAETVKDKVELCDQSRHPGGNGISRFSWGRQ
jgi:hypothetical protein